MLVIDLMYLNFLGAMLSRLDEFDVLFVVLLNNVGQFVNVMDDLVSLKVEVTFVKDEVEFFDFLRW